MKFAIISEINNLILTRSYHFHSRHSSCFLLITHSHMGLDELHHAKKTSVQSDKTAAMLRSPEETPPGWNATNLLFRMVQELTQKTNGRLWEYGFKVAFLCDGVVVFWNRGDTNFLGGGDSNIFYFHPYLGEIIEFDWYFSSGLKPSTSFLVAKHVKVTVLKMLEKLPWKMFRWFSMGFIIPGYKLGAGFKHSLFSPLVREDSQFD